MRMRKLDKKSYSAFLDGEVLVGHTTDMATRIMDMDTDILMVSHILSIKRNKIQN